MTKPANKWMQKARLVPQPVYAGDQVEAIARALEATDKAATERAAQIASAFGPSRPLANPNERKDLIIGRWEGEQAASAAIAAAIRKGEQ